MKRRRADREFDSRKNNSPRQMMMTIIIQETIMVMVIREGRLGVIRLLSRVSNDSIESRVKSRGINRCQRMMNIIHSD